MLGSLRAHIQACGASPASVLQKNMSGTSSTSKILRLILLVKEAFQMKELLRAKLEDLGIKPHNILPDRCRVSSSNTPKCFPRLMVETAAPFTVAPLYDARPHMFTSLNVEYVHSE